jgi:transcriptional regulator with XRE-family HTH domain
VRRRREALAVSQEAFAVSIKMHRAYYGAFERGKKNAELSTMETICKGLGVKIWEVMREAEG